MLDDGLSNIYQETFSLDGKRGQNQQNNQNEQVPGSFGSIVNE